MGLFNRHSHRSQPPPFSLAQPSQPSLLPLPQPLPPPKALHLAPPLPPDGSVDPTDPLQIAIHYHELNCLDVATYYFSVAAARGHPVGLFMYAMSMRHGWGCRKDEETAVHLLQKAAETAVTDLNVPFDASAPAVVGGGGGEGGGTLQPPAPSQALRQIATTELTLAIYELAMSFKQGWGVPKSKTTSTYYMTIAAQLGDVDAQQELGECYLRGDGVKRDKKMAARWFRDAERQGAHMVSMQWIWKSKYDPPQGDSTDTN
ncbi:hypothetical protein HKX48_003892 [Thoreauomyces humboldtii]|nr:hypothetical protein HKX48_003892 [Thoreauomyces humboldtii]